ncbi:MAG: hypothetical protein LBS22_01555 [Puniceicoccales bacterium]|jgi:uncharacterized RDD family membrane protein YckC|nr:hypothetical protein [Puniceicoccales bacterium]
MASVGNRVDIPDVSSSATDNRQLGGEHGNGERRITPANAALPTNMELVGRGALALTMLIVGMLIVGMGALVVALLGTALVGIGVLGVLIYGLKALFERCGELFMGRLSFAEFFSV